MSNFLLISLLKQYGIKRLVLSSGTRNIPFVTAVETDDYFECFSVIDERNAILRTGYVPAITRTYSYCLYEWDSCK